MLITVACEHLLFVLQTNEVEPGLQQSTSGSQQQLWNSSVPDPNGQNSTPQLCGKLNCFPEGSFTNVRLVKSLPTRTSQPRQSVTLVELALNAFLLPAFVVKHDRCLPAAVGGFCSGSCDTGVPPLFRLTVFALIVAIVNVNPHDVAGSQNFPSAKIS